MPTIGPISGALLPSPFALLQFLDTDWFALFLGLLGLGAFFGDGTCRKWLGRHGTSA